MTRTNVLAFWLGLLVTVAVTGIAWIGGLTRWERLAIDYRFDTVPRLAPPMSDEIVHVDIDDGALNVVGRWPWDRSQLADVIDELRTGGARTIALDLLLSNEQQYPGGSSRSIDHDELFARALGTVQCVLAVDVKTQKEFKELWSGPVGQTELDGLLGVLGENIELTNDEVLARTKITAERRAYFRTRPAQMRQAAAWKVLRTLDHPPESLDAFERLVAPDRNKYAGDYPERHILETVLRQAEAWEAVRPHLLPADSVGTFEDEAPLPRLAERGDAFGFVNVGTQTHSDGIVREMTVRMDAPGGGVVQFGLSAAALHMGIEARSITLDDSAIALGEVTLPLRSGKLWIAWPALGPHSAWFDGLAKTDTDAIEARHLSIAVLVNLAAQRRTHQENLDKLEWLTRAVLYETQRRSLRDEISDASSVESRDIARDFISFEYGFDGVPTPEMIREAQAFIVSDDTLPDRDRRPMLAALDRAVRWTQLDARFDGEVRDGERRGLTRDERAELARLTTEFIVEDMLEPIADGRGPLVQERAAGAVQNFLTQASSGADDDVTSTYRTNCEAWRETASAVSEGENSLRENVALVANKVRDKLVFIGWTATGAAADFVSTAQRARTPGVNVHSAIAHMGLTGSAMRFPSRAAGMSITLVVGLLCTLTAVRLATTRSAFAAVAVLAIYVGVGGVWMFSTREFVMPVVGPVTAGSASWIVVTAIQAARSQRERQRIERQFKARVSAQLVDHLVTNPDAMTVTGEEREMTTIFADLAGFTTVAEKLGGAATVSTLNRYMIRLTAVLVDQGAYVNKFLGDGVMAFWSAFALDQEQATRGCIAALECQSAVEAINKEPGFENIPKISMRVGVATGMVVVGDCGAPPALNDYTVIGDAVNLAARLESANKQFGTGILINEKTQELLDKDAPLRLRKMGRIIVVGQHVSVGVFEVLPPDTDSALIELSDRAVDAYADANFDACKAAFEEFEQKYGESKLAALYREAIDVVGDDFDGALHLMSK